ncbi:beta-propeller domain-containing protein [Cellulosilyticum sp. I15G10I2]|uniref:beta-propeller domain-containing protein n=1 Tax=Cellulosilyticum sp. I15G10I2 TaxID=1892843 RepID=UPI0009F2FEAF|nr:beta-propeller domain-containing protein [Cellulosilyticum sp. I15G10I2]
MKGDRGMYANKQKIKRIFRIGLLIGVLAAAQVLWGGIVQASDLVEAYQLTKIKSYEELVKVLKENHVITKDSRYLYRYNTEDVSSLPSTSSTESKSAEGSLDAISYSATNIQVERVDEADTLKNDSRFIYQKIGNDKIAIVDTKQQLKTVSIIEAKKESNIAFDTMFLDNNTLIVVGKRQQIKKVFPIEPTITNVMKNTYYRDTYKSFSTLQVYDLSDKRAPKLIREIEAEGNLIAVRKIDQTVYMLTNKVNNHVLEDNFIEEDILPLYKDSLVSDAVKTIVPENIWYQPWKRAQGFTLITALQLDEKIPVEVQGVLGATDEIYMNEKALYLTSSSYSYSSSTTTIISKYNIDKQKVTYAVSGHVKGSLLNQFSMDEYNGNFRIAVTDYFTNTSAVYVLNNQLKTLGQLENLAPGERIYSVRFTGEKGYVVTFKQVDPLFVIDLSNAKAPQVLGELKVPGFSQYLHPITDELMVGIGRSTADIIRRDENGKEIVTGVIAAGIKLSLFDVKDPTCPKEINHIILGTNGSYTGAAENHKMVTVHNEKQLLAIPVFIHYNQADNIKDFEGAYVFGIKNGKLVGTAKLGKIGSPYSYYNSTDRVCYIGDKLYFLYDNKINEYEIDTFSRIQTVSLN